MTFFSCVHGDPRQRPDPVVGGDGPDGDGNEQRETVQDQGQPNWMQSPVHR